MALNASQLVTVAEITREELADVISGAVSLTTEQVTSISADIVTWNLIRDSHVRVKGGSKGIDFDNERKREAIRQRIRKAFGWPLISPEVDVNALSIFELEVGSNFG